MAQLIKSLTVTPKEGELSVNISLDLNINLNNMSIQATATVDKPEEEKVDWAIPSFESAEKVSFGKKE